MPGAADTFDYVIIGAGSAGCVLAQRLSEGGRHTVCVLEAGPPDRSIFIHVPIGWVKVAFNPALTWQFATDPVPGAANRRIPIMLGKTLGGSSSINGLCVFRGQPSDYDHWARLGNPGWSYEDVLPYFKKAERRPGAAADSPRGQNGPWTVSDSAWEHPLVDSYMAGAVELGHRRNPDYNSGDHEGVARCQLTVDGKRRVSTARAYLHPAVRRGGVDVRTHALASALVFEGRRAVGVRYQDTRDASVKREVRAHREVILSAGAINTPRLLQVSGVGPADLLGELGVPVVHASPGVGANLHDHYYVRLNAKVQGVTTINQKTGGPRLWFEVLKWAIGQPSILELGTIAAVIHSRSRPDLVAPDLQISFIPGGARPRTAAEVDRTSRMMLCAFHALRPESRGSVRAVSRDVTVAPSIQPNYLAAANDQATAIAGIRQCRALLRSKALSKYFVEETTPGDQVRTDEELLAFARETGATTFHPVGTARMGHATDSLAVVDPRLRVHGVDGLRVVDASIMPQISSGATNAPTIMIAERAFALILEDAR